MLKYLHEGEYRTNTKCGKEGDEEEPGDLWAILLCGLNVIITTTTTIIIIIIIIIITTIIIITILLHRLAGTTRW